MRSDDLPREPSPRRRRAGRSAGCARSRAAQARCPGARAGAPPGGRARSPIRPPRARPGAGRRGSVARAEASMSRRCSWAVSSAAGRSGSCSPTSSSAPSAFCSASRSSARAFGVRNSVRNGPSCSTAEPRADEGVLERAQLGEDGRRLLRADDPLQDARAWGPRPARFRSPETVPSSGTSSPTSALRAVVFPLPFGPISACTRPGASSRSTWLRATRLPKRFVRPRARNGSGASTRGSSRAGGLGLGTGLGGIRLRHQPRAAGSSPAPPRPRTSSSP